MNSTSLASTTSLMFALYRQTGGDLAASLKASPSRGCTEILKRFRFASRELNMTSTGCTRWGITARGMHFVALDGSKAERDARVIAAHGGLLQAVAA
jgi:hypothetical protein